MLERALIATALIALAYLAFAGFKRWHMRRAGRESVAPGRPTLLYFRSDTCSPCVTQGRYLGIVEERFQPAVAFRKVEADSEPEIAAQYGVFTLPTILILDSSGEVRHANYGLTDSQRLAYQLEKML